MAKRLQQKAKRQQKTARNKRAHQPTAELVCINRLDCSSASGLLYYIKRRGQRMLWVGLGNPGRSYAGNRHNVGFMALDRIVRDYSFSDWKVNTSSAVRSAKAASDQLRYERAKAFVLHE